MTARQIMMASAGIEKPYRSMSVVRSDLVALVRQGLLKRQEIPREGPGECERLYFLSRRARSLVPELGDLRPSASAFRPVALSQLEHTLGVAEFTALLHRDVAASDGRARLLRVLRDRELAVRVDARRYGLGETLVVPDGTILMTLDGATQLFFLELMNRGGVIRPGIPQSLERSFAAKLWRYRALLKVFREDETIYGLAREHGVSLPPGFRVLVVSTRGEEHLEHLREVAGSFRTMCYFTRLAQLEVAGSMITEPVWELPSGRRRGISD